MPFFLDSVCVLGHSVVYDSLHPHGLQPARLLCPLDFPGKNIGVGSLSFLKGIFPTQDMTPGLLHWADSLPSQSPGSSKNTGVGSHSLHQGIFPTQESNPGLLHHRQILYQLSYQVAHTVMRLPTMMETGFNPWVGKISCKRKWQPTPVFFPGKSHGQRSLIGYSPWGRKESDMTEQLN